MLVSDLFKLFKFETTEGTVQASINLNSNHKVFEGHFPEQPVVPGVMQIQLVKELLEKASGKSLFLYKIDSVKYLIPIAPSAVPCFEVKIDFSLIEENDYKISASILENDKIFTRIKAQLKIR